MLLLLAAVTHIEYVTTEFTSTTSKTTTPSLKQETEGHRIVDVDFSQELCYRPRYWSHGLSG